jgi:valyl-tRNA synthetase
VDKYGADPLRFALVTGSTPGNDINLDPARVERNWRFVNKIWQMSSFVVQNLEGETERGVPPPAELDLPSRWILSRLNGLVAMVQRLFDTYQYGEAGRQIDDFLWGEFADYYIEISKHPLYNGSPAEKAATRRVLVHVLDTCLRLLHPYMPFVTEELWRYLPHEGEALIIARWPKADTAYIDERAESAMNVLVEMVRGLRNLRTEYNVEPSRKLAISVAPGSYGEVIDRHRYLFARLCNISEVRLLESSAAAPDKAASVVVSDVTVYLPMAEMVDTAAECERLTKERDQLQAQIGKSEAMLGNEQFVSRARPDVVERERNRLAEMQASAAQIAERLSALCG